jgi:hypothetical protein
MRLAGMPPAAYYNMAARVIEVRGIAVVIRRGAFKSGN